MDKMPEPIKEHWNSTQFREHPNYKKYWLKYYEEGKGMYTADRMAAADCAADIMLAQMSAERKEDSP